jgi:AcrR family transcriptional regulator
MSKTSADWRQARQESARLAIVEAAWQAVRDEGLAGLSLRDLARRAGTTTPTIDNYFASKHEIYDAMFEQAAAEFEAHMTVLDPAEDAESTLTQSFRRFVEFCTADTARYQLLFQRTIPGFEPSRESYAPAVRALEASRARLARNGITSQRHLDLWTALTTGLVSQQIANDPGGNRWTRLTDEAVSMFLANAQKVSTQQKTKTRRRRTR